MAYIGTATLALPAQRRLPTRITIFLTVILAGAAGYLATPSATAADAVSRAGEELTHLLRMMALLKLALMAGAALLVDWRLRFPTRSAFALLYYASLATMAAGPGLIWGMAHVVLGAVLLHSGLALLLVLFWRDPGSPAMLWARRLGQPRTGS